MPSIYKYVPIENEFSVDGGMRMWKIDIIISNLANPLNETINFVY